MVCYWCVVCCDNDALIVSQCKSHLLLLRLEKSGAKGFKVP